MNLVGHCSLGAFKQQGIGADNHAHLVFPDRFENLFGRLVHGHGHFVDHGLGAGEGVLVFRAFQRLVHDIRAYGPGVYHGNTHTFTVQFRPQGFAEALDGRFRGAVGGLSGGAAVTVIGLS